MPDFKAESFQFPDEIDKKAPEDTYEIVVEDDTPAEDKGKSPMPEDIVKKLEEDELDSYSSEQKERFKQMKKVWHDERRAKEAALRENSEAISAAQRLSEENRRMRGMLEAGQKEYVEAMKKRAEIELEQAKRNAREAYDEGDTDKILDSQQELAKMTYRQEKMADYEAKPLQQENVDVQQRQVPKPDDKALAWQKRNEWFGKDDEMTASALGLHEKLRKSGVPIGSEEYYDSLDKTMRRRFPESFGEPEREFTPPPKKSATVVAAASRSTTPKRVSLRQSQVDLARKLGLTPEQYVAEVLKLESKNV